MRAEHRQTADERNLDKAWRSVVLRMGKAGAAKAVKVRSHRIDRRVSARRAIEEQLEDMTNEDDLG